MTKKEVNKGKEGAKDVKLPSAKKAISKAEIIAEGKTGEQIKKVQVHPQIGSKVMAKGKQEGIKVETPKKAEQKVVRKPASKNVDGKTIRVKQMTSGAGRLKSQIATLKGLGLNKLNKEVVLQDTASVRGMIEKVKHLVKVIN